MVSRCCLSIFLFLLPLHCSKHSIHRAVSMRLGVSVNEMDIKQCLNLAVAAIHPHTKFFYEGRDPACLISLPHYRFSCHLKSQCCNVSLRHLSPHCTAELPSPPSYSLGQNKTKRGTTAITSSRHPYEWPPIKYVQGITKFNC